MKKNVVRIVISCGPSALYKTSVSLSEVLGIDVETAAHLVTVYSDKSHDAKYDVIVRHSPELVGVDDRLRLYFNPQGKMSHNKLEFQVGCKALAEYLLQKYDAATA